MKGTPLVTNPNPLFEDGPGPGLEPVDGEFQLSLETGYPGAGAHLIFVLKLKTDLRELLFGKEA